LITPGRLIKPVLRDVGYLPLASDPDIPRWRNTAQWARHSMVKEGLLKADSPRGIWEITDAGRASIFGNTALQSEERWHSCSRKGRFMIRRVILVGDRGEGLQCGTGYPGKGPVIGGWKGAYHSLGEGGSPG